MILPNQRRRFAIPREVAFLNCAYMAPLMDAVVAAGEAGLRAKTQPWRIATPDFFDDGEALRAAWASLLGAPPDHLALTTSASYGISLAANAVAVEPGRRVLLAAEQFPSNVYPWIEKARRSGGEARFVPRPEDHDWTRAVLEQLDERAAVVALPQVHWAYGTVFDLERIGRRAREVGAALVLDLTQSLGALPVDLGRIRPDFAAGAAYKWLLGPYSLGYLYADPARLDSEPLEHNWIQRGNARDFAGLVDYTDDRQAGARRFDAGERSNFALVPAALAAARQLVEWGPENIAETLAPMTARLARDAAAFGFTAVPESLRAPHYLALSLPAPLAGGPGSDAADRVRAALAERGVFVSVRGSSVRITPHLYNDEADLDSFRDALGAAVGEAPADAATAR